MWTDRQAIEIFHLLFLRSFGARVDKTLFSLKGGCNLRFYHRSIRYSEDMDLDIKTMAPGTLRSNVDAVLEADAFRHSLQAQSIAIEKASAPKQTQAVQRWKISLRVTQQEEPIPTKIEFSRRALDPGIVIEPVSAELIRQYRIYQVIVQHYDATNAFAQKIGALALRTETQARDIFDLDLLVNAGPTPTQLNKSQRDLIPKAIDNALSVSYDDFTGQVVAYLEPQAQRDYNNREAWNSLQERVVDALQTL
jgi:predicted nucleotidyltransferase component of viral defense system